MIIIDYSQVAISNIMEHLGNSKKELDVDLARHMILNAIRAVVKKYKSEYGSNIVIACDDKNSWRKDVFAYYKGKRSKNREDSGLDWNSIYSCIDTIKKELIDNTHYKVVQVERAEADDIIGVLATRQHIHEKIMIISGDKDFVQLQRYKGVSQYSPILKKDIVSDSPTEQLKRLIIKGDSGDGIPNILSPDDSLMTGTRQKSVYEEKLVEWVNQDPETFCDEQSLIKYKRNQILIDLSMIPENIQEKIIYTYENTKPKAKMKFLNYLISKRLNNLIEVINEF